MRGQGTKTAHGPLPLTRRGRSVTAPLVEEKLISLSKESLLETYSDSPYADAYLTREIGEYMIMYQLLAKSVVSKQVFETALLESAKACKMAATQPESKTNPGHDLIINDEKVSLKTEGAKSIREDSLHISKLMEAAWSKNANVHQEMQALVNENTKRHFEDYDRVLVLRSFQTTFPDSDKKAVRYDLVEIPKQVLTKINDLGPNNYEPLSPRGSTRADVFVEDEKAFTLVVDGSDNKLTVRGLKTKFCQKHASWWLPAPEDM